MLDFVLNIKNPMDGPNTKDSQILKDNQNFKDIQIPKDRAKQKVLLKDI